MKRRQTVEMVGRVFMLTRFGASVRHNGLEANVNAKEIENTKEFEGVTFN